MVTVRLPDELKERIDAARGDVPRERWIRRALEATLSSRDASAGEETAVASPSASPRTLAKNLGETANGEVVRQDPSKPAEFVLPKIAPRKRAW